MYLCKEARYLSCLVVAVLELICLKMGRHTLFLLDSFSAPYNIEARRCPSCNMALELSASIAGLLSLAGQCLDGAIKLHSFWKSIQNASATLRGFLGDLNTLIQALNDVQALLNRLDGCGLSHQPLEGSNSLRYQLQAGNEELQQWIEVAHKTRPREGNGLSAWFARFRIASRTTWPDPVRPGIRDRAQNIGACLSALGR